MTPGFLFANRLLKIRWLFKEATLELLSMALVRLETSLVETPPRFLLVLALADMVLARAVVGGHGCLSALAEI